MLIGDDFKWNGTKLNYVNFLWIIWKQALWAKMNMSVNESIDFGID